MAMSQSFEFYTERAEQSAAEASVADLANVRERALRSEKTWRGLAAQANRVLVERAKAELARANEAHAILDGTPAGQIDARRLGVRFALVDPTCPDPDGNALAPPRVGTPAFTSERLLVLKL